MKISMIAAVGKNLELGKGNDLIWKFKDDMKYFKETTLNHTVVMGDKTYYSIGHPLIDRKNIVLSFDKLDIPGTINVNDYKEILNLDDDEVFIIGGAMVYKLFLPYADNLYLTEINDEGEADSFFPSFDKNLYTREYLKSSSCNGIDYDFVIYRKRD